MTSSLFPIEQPSAPLVLTDEGILSTALCMTATSMTMCEVLTQITTLCSYVNGVAERRLKWKTPIYNKKQHSLRKRC